MVMAETWTRPSGRMSSIVYVLALALPGAGCGASQPTEAPDKATDASAGADGASADAGAAPPGELAGRWWGWLPFGSQLASSNNPALAAFEVGDARTTPGAPPPKSWPAKLWFFGQPTELTVSPSTTGPSHYDIGGLAITVCGNVVRAPVLVASGNTLSWQVDTSACGGSTTQVAGTVFKSSARRVQLRTQSATSAVLSRDGRYFAFATEFNHPWLWDATRQSLSDMAPGVADGGNVAPSGQARIVLSPDDGHAVYCAEGGDTGSALVTYDIARGQVHPLVSAGGVCDPAQLAFSADGTHLAFTVGMPTQSGVDLRLWDFTAGATASVFHGTPTIDPQWFWPGKSGRYLLYYAPPSTSPAAGQDIYEPFAAYDVQSQQSQMLGQARWGTPSPDGRFLAFSRSDGKLVVWDEQSGSASVIDSLGAQGSIGSYHSPTTNDIAYVPLGASPDGSQLLYLDGSQSLREVPLGSTAPRTISASVACSPTSAPQGPQGAVFSDDSKYVAFVGSQCVGGAAAFAVHAVDLASGSDGSLNIPPQSSMAAVGAVSPSGALGYFFTDGLQNVEVHGWSTAAGDATAQAKAGVLDSRIFGISDDGNRIFFQEATTSIDQEMLWDRTLGLSTLGLNAPDPNHPLAFFTPLFDPPSGIAFVFDSNESAFVVSGPGTPPQSSVKPDPGTTAVVSLTRKTVAVAGTLGVNHGVHTFSFAAGVKPNFVEGGAVVATTDSAVYFIAADGVCVSALP
jgi:hypothetical protein